MKRYVAPTLDRSPEGAQRIPEIPTGNNLSPDFSSLIRAAHAQRDAARLNPES